MLALVRHSSTQGWTVRPFECGPLLGEGRTPIPTRKRYYCPRGPSQIRGLSLRCDHLSSVRGDVHATGSPTQERLLPGSVRSILAAAFGLAFLIAAITTIGSVPAACSACHTSQSSAMNETAHARLDCYSCHLTNGAWGFPESKSREFVRMYPAALMGRGLTQASATTARSSCLSCHEDILQQVTSGMWFRIDHRACAPAPTCDGCHARTAHGQSLRWQSGPVMGECVACHSERRVSIECDTCHTENERSRPTAAAKGPWQVTHGANWQQTHGLGDVESCGTCHPNDYCVQCHGVAVPHPPDFGGTHGTLATAQPAVCVRCHQSRTDFCDACHTMEMPHPEGFLVAHSTLAENRTDDRCFRCHAATDCEACHAAHVHPGGGQGIPVPWSNTPERSRP